MISTSGLGQNCLQSGSSEGGRVKHRGAIQLCSIMHMETDGRRKNLRHDDDHQGITMAP